VAGLLAVPDAGRAGDAYLTANQCLAGKVKALGGSASSRARCLSKAAAKGTPVDACLQQSSDRFTGGARPEKAPFAKLEARGGCLTQGDGAALEAALAGFASDLERLVGGTGRSRCDAGKLQCASKYMKGVLGCHAKGARKGGVVEGACLEKRLVSFSDPERGCYAKALAKGDCSVPEGRGAQQALADVFVRDSICTLDPDAGGCAPNPLDRFLPLDALSLAGVSADAFNPLDATLRFVLVGAQYSEFPEDVELRVNGSLVPPGSLVRGPSEVAATSVLEEGRNEVAFTATDDAGRPLFLEATLWAGSETLTVTLVDEGGMPFTEPTDVRVSLGDAPSVAAEGSTSSGTLQLQNLPDRTLLIQASTAENHLGLLGAIGSQGSVEVVVRGFDPPSPIANNDFGLGLDGWDVGGAAFVQIVPHTEGLPDPIPPPPPQATALSAAASAKAALAPRGAPGDLVLRSSGKNEQSVSRSFQTVPGTTSVRVRYRWVTSEIPCDCYGTQFNDYYSVSVRSQNTGDAVAESKSVNSFPLSDYDPGTGATDWRDATLEVDPAGDTIQVDIAVSNVADDRWDSEVIVDFVEEGEDEVRLRLAWSPYGGLDLFYRIESAELSEAVTLEVYFADGPGSDDRLGSPLFSLQLREGYLAGEYGPERVFEDLSQEPDGTTHLIALSSETNVVSLPDARIAYGPNANQAVVWEEMREVVRDSLRVAGQATGWISSSARTPADQARAMFNNLVNPIHTIAENIALQKAIYAPPGDRVIDAFAAAAAGLTRDQIVAARTAFQATLLAEIEARGPANVSNHCADPAEISVADVAAAPFDSTTGILFVGSADLLGARVIDERTVNSCYHLEVQ